MDSADFHELDTSLESTPENTITCLCEGEKGADLNVLRKDKKYKNSELLRFNKS